MVMSSLRSQGVRTCGKRLGEVPSDCGAASENAVRSNMRFPGSAAFHGLNVEGLKTLSKPPEGVLKLAHTPGPFQKLGRVRELGWPSGVPLRWRIEAETFQPPTSALTKPFALLRS